MLIETKVGRPRADSPIPVHIRVAKPQMPLAYYACAITGILRIVASVNRPGRLAIAAHLPAPGIFHALAHQEALLLLMVQMDRADGGSRYAAHCQWVRDEPDRQADQETGRDRRLQGLLRQAVLRYPDLALLQREEDE